LEGVKGTTSFRVLPRLGAKGWGQQNFQPSGWAGSEHVACPAFRRHDKNQETQQHTQIVHNTTGLNLMTTSNPVMTRPIGCCRGLLTIAEVAESLRVPVSWVYDRTRARGLNRIPGFRLGKYWRFQEAEVLGWLERQRSGGRANA